MLEQQALAPGGLLLGQGLQVGLVALHHLHDQLGAAGLEELVQHVAAVGGVGGGDDLLGGAEAGDAGGVGAQAVGLAQLQLLGVQQLLGGLAGGLPGSQGLVGPLELRWLGWYGLATTKAREGAADYVTRPLGMAAAGVGVRVEEEDLARAVEERS